VDTNISEDSIFYLDDGGSGLLPNVSIHFPNHALS